MICLVAVKLGVGGIGIGAAVALHSATCFARGRYHDGSAYPPINLTAVVALNGWLPQARFDFIYEMLVLNNYLVVLLKMLTILPLQPHSSITKQSGHSPDLPSSRTLYIYISTTSFFFQIVILRLLQIIH